MREQIAKEVYQSHGHNYATGNNVPPYHHLMPEQHARLLGHADHIISITDAHYRAQVQGLPNRRAKELERALKDEQWGTVPALQGLSDEVENFRAAMLALLGTEQSTPEGGDDGRS